MGLRSLWCYRWQNCVNETPWRSPPETPALAPAPVLGQASFLRFVRAIIFCGLSYRRTTRHWHRAGRNRRHGCRWSSDHSRAGFHRLLPDSSPRLPSPTPFRTSHGRTAINWSRVRRKSHLSNAAVAVYSIVRHSELCRESTLTHLDGIDVDKDHVDIYICRQHEGLLAGR